MTLIYKDYKMEYKLHVFGAEKTECKFLLLHEKG